MKNRLIAAFLMLTALPAFAGETPAQQLRKAEMLTHLKTANIDAQNVRQELKDHLDMKTRNEEHLYLKLTITLWDTLYNTFDPCDELALAEVDIYFDLLCQGQTIDQLSYASQTNERLTKIIRRIVDITDNTTPQHAQQKKEY